jgi:ABC-type uncharacterized transport system substrate-binding protein
MKRREFMALFGGAAAAWPLTARAQPGVVPLIGLADAGYIEGKNVAIEYRWGEGLASAFSAMVKERADAFIVLPSPMLFGEHRRMVELAANNRLPGMYQAREFVDAGGLMSYGANLDDLFRRTATYVDKILKGAKPADLPVERPTKFELVINLKAARAVGLTINRDILLVADEVIE